MSDTPRSKWWLVLLVVSLALNLLVGGAMLARGLTRESPERLMGTSYTQLIPRGFFREIPRERRREILDILKKYRKEFQADRDTTEDVAAKFGEALGAEPYSAENVNAVVAEFAEKSRNLAARGGAAALEIIGTLTPEERRILAKAIRERAARGKGKK